MPKYVVTWSIEVNADHEVAAARLAREIQLDPGCDELRFGVEDEDAEYVVVDLDVGDIAETDLSGEMDAALKVVQWPR